MGHESARLLPLLLLLLLLFSYVRTYAVSSVIFAKEES